MPGDKPFLVRVERTFRSRHVSTLMVDVDSPEEALAEAERQFQSGAYFPCDDYAEQLSGYDDAGDWEFVSAHRDY